LAILKNHGLQVKKREESSEDQLHSMGGGGKGSNTRNHPEGAKGKGKTVKKTLP